MEIVERLDEARCACNVLEHPFYRRWTEGRIRPGELALYAGEYRHAVVALAEASRRAAEHAGPAHRDRLARHAEEEEAHIALWDAFADATSERAGDGARHGREPLATTRACAQAWTGGDALLEHLAVLYVLEASQPAIAQTKLEGLVDHYGYRTEGPATAYFTEHGQRDVEHAADARELIGELMAASDDQAGDCERMLARAREALQGNWTLLDGVEAARQPAGRPAG